MLMELHMMLQQSVVSDHPIRGSLMGCPIVIMPAVHTASSYFSDHLPSEEAVAACLGYVQRLRREAQRDNRPPPELNFTFLMARAICDYLSPSFTSVDYGFRMSRLDELYWRHGGHKKKVVKKPWTFSGIHPLDRAAQMKP